MMWIGRMGGLSQAPTPASMYFPGVGKGTPAASRPLGPTRRLRGASRLVRTSRSDRSFAFDRTARDAFDIAAANADIVQLAVRELGQFTHRLAISAPSGELLRDRLERGHVCSFSGRRWAY